MAGSGEKKGGLKGRWQRGSPSRRSDWIILVALAIHIFADVIQGFSWARLPIRLFVYALGLTIISLMLRDQWKHFLPALIGVSAAVLFGFPLLIQILSNSSFTAQIILIVSTVMTIVPIIAIYLMSTGVTYPFDPDDSGFIPSFFKAIFFFRFTQWVKIWMIGWTIISVILLVGYLGEAAQNLPAQPSGYVDSAGAIRNAGVYIGDAWTSLGTNFNNLWAGGVTLYNQQLNRTLGENYRGQVEQTSQRTGVFIDNFKSTGRYYSYSGQSAPITFFPYITARSFSGDMDMKFKCIAYDMRNRSNNVTGDVNPSEVTLRREDNKGVVCRFNTNSETALAPSRYNVEFTAEFDFETWAYIKYVFMEREFIDSMRLSGENINTKFDIAKKSTTIYTAGPAKIGMRDDILNGMPLALEYSDNTLIPIGITLENANRQTGEILNVNDFQLIVPQYFTMSSDDCTRTITRQFSGSLEQDYHVYSFERDPTIDPELLRQYYLTIDCNMKITGSDALNMLGGSGGAAEASMVGMANYTYLLKKRISINVEKNPLS